MPIQIPQLKRIDPTEPASVGRIDVNLPDSTKADAQTSRGLVDLGKDAVDYFQKVENKQ